MQLQPGMDVHPDVALVVAEVRRVSNGRAPHALGSPEAAALERALDACTSEFELAALAAVGRRVLAEASRALIVQPLRAPFAKTSAGAPSTNARQSRRKPKKDPS